MTMPEQQAIEALPIVADALTKITRIRQIQKRMNTKIRLRWPPLSGFLQFFNRHHGGSHVGWKVQNELGVLINNGFNANLTFNRLK